MKTIQGRSYSDDENIVGTTLRLPRAVRDDLKIQAIRAGRSFNTHVVMVLQRAQALDASERPSGYSQSEREARSYVRSALRRVGKLMEGVA